MNTLELAALRRRAREYGLRKGSSRAIERYKASHQFGVHELPLSPEPLTEPRRIDENATRWVVALCRPQLARAVADDLDQMGFRAYCPIGRRKFKHARVRGSRKRQERIHEYAVFGRYLFVGEIDEPLQTSFHGGIVDVVGDSSGALSLDPKVIRALNDAELAGKWDDTRLRDWERVPFKRGDRVTIAPGSPLAGFFAVVDEITKAGVVVAVELFGRQNEVTVPADKLEMA